MLAPFEGRGLHRKRDGESAVYSDKLKLLQIISFNNFSYHPRTLHSTQHIHLNYVYTYFKNCMVGREKKKNPRRELGRELWSRRELPSTGNHFTIENRLRGKRKMFPLHIKIKFRTWNRRRFKMIVGRAKKESRERAGRRGKKAEARKEERRLKNVKLPIRWQYSTLVAIDVLLCTRVCFLW